MPRLFKLRENSANYKSEIILLNYCPKPKQLPSPTAMKKLFRIYNSYILKEAFLVVFCQKKNAKTYKNFHKTLAKNEKVCYYNIATK